MNDDFADENAPATVTERTSVVAQNLKDHAQQVLDRGKRRSEKIIRHRQSSTLLRDLGRVTYDAHLDGDDTIDISKRDEIVAALDALQASDPEVRVR